MKLPTETAIRPDDLPSAPVDTVWFWKANMTSITVPRRLTPLALAMLGVLPLVTALCVGLHYRREFREILPLDPSQGHGWQPLPPPRRDDTALMSAPERHQLVWNIEHFLSDDLTRRLDLLRTVEATARAGGFVRLHFQPAVYDRAIWFWRDRQLAHAIPRTAVQQLMATLQAAGLEAQHGLFTDVPDRVDWPARAGYRPEHEEGHGRQAVVVILTDGAGLQQRLKHPLWRVATERLLRSVRHWPHLCFVDCSADGASLRAVLAPYRLETITLEDLPGWLGGVVVREQAPARQALYGDERVWAGAIALGGSRVEVASAHTLRAELGLQVSPWQLERIMDDVQDPGKRTRHINWLLGCEVLGEDNLPTAGSLARRALDWWQQRYQEAAAQMQAQENPLLPWSNSLASRRWQVEQAVLRLYLDPVGAAGQLTRLANEELREDIRERLATFAATEHAAQGRHEGRVIYLPWRLEAQPVMTRYQLRQLQFAGNVAPQAAAALQRSPRLVLAVAMLATLGLTAWGSALYRWLTPEVPGVLVQNRVYEHPAFVVQTIWYTEPLAAGDYRVTLGSARHVVTVESVPAGAVIAADWQWQSEPNAIALRGSTVLRAGRLAQPIRACSQDWPQRALVVLAAAFEQEVARQLAIRLLDKGSADQVLLGERWEGALPEWLGSSRALQRNTQVLVVVPTAAEAERAVRRLEQHPGPWAVASSDDLAGVARAIDFKETLTVERVPVPWRVHRMQGRVFVSGGPERQEEAGIEWVHVCPGTFTMGRLSGEDAIAENEQDAKRRALYQREVVEPRRTVVLSGFQMAATETTAQQYGETEALPRVNIDWKDARAFCQGKNIKGDLPTEAQWEYAARGGSRFPWSFGDDEGALNDYAWFGEDIAGKAHDVRQKRPNPLGLYDIHGHVWEWVRDWYGDYVGGVFVDPPGPDAGQCWVVSEDKIRLSDEGCRVMRGGSFGDPPRTTRPRRTEGGT